MKIKAKKLTEKEREVYDFLVSERGSRTHKKGMGCKTYHAICKSLMRKGVVFSDKTDKGFLGYYALK
jgi:predicted DNA-binding transcriptional regulator